VHFALIELIIIIHYSHTAEESLPLVEAISNLILHVQN
jgi:hypothetical protein